MAKQMQFQFILGIALRFYTLGVIFHFEKRRLAKAMQSVLNI